MKEINTVIFDMDGVIFDTEKAYLHIWSKVFSEYGYTLKKEDYISVMGKGHKAVRETFVERYGDDLPITEMYNKKDKLLAEVIENNEVPLKEGVVELLSYLRDNNYNIALATSAKRSRVDIQLKGSNIESFFNTIVTRDDIVNTKPDPEIFLKAAKNIGVNPENCIVIEDSPAGIKAAYNGNMIAFHVEDLKIADEEIIKSSQKQFKSLIEVLEYIKNL